MTIDENIKNVKKLNKKENDREKELERELKKLRAARRNRSSFLRDAKVYRRKQRLVDQFIPTEFATGNRINKNRITRRLNLLKKFGISSADDLRGTRKVRTSARNIGALQKLYPNIKKSTLKRFSKIPVRKPYRIVNGEIIAGRYSFDYTVLDWNRLTDIDTGKPYLEEKIEELKQPYGVYAFGYIAPGGFELKNILFEFVNKETLINSVFPDIILKYDQQWRTYIHLIKRKSMS